MYSVLVTTLQTERGRELTKKFEGDAQRILEELHIYCTQSEMTHNHQPWADRYMERNHTTVPCTFQGETQTSGQFVCRA